MKFIEELKMLISEIESEPNALKRFGLIQRQDALLANNRNEILAIVEACVIVEEELRNRSHYTRTAQHLARCLEAFNVESV